jgi:hypothetical protein
MSCDDCIERLTEDLEAGARKYLEIPEVRLAMRILKDADMGPVTFLTALRLLKEEENK